MEPVDRLIALFYDSVLEQSHWALALGALAEATGCVDVSLVAGGRMTDGRLPSYGAVAGKVFRPDRMADYLSHYVRWDPQAPIIFDTPVGAPVCSDALLCEDEIARNPFFQELLIPSGGRHYGGWVVYADQALAVGVTLHRPNAPVDRPLLRKWWPVARHLGHAASLAARLAPRLASAEGFRRALDACGAACLLVDAAGRPIDASKAGEALLAAGMRLRIGADRRLRLDGEADTARLRRLIASACAGRGGGEMDVDDPAAGRLKIEIAPAGVTAENPFASRHAGHALILIEQETTPRAPDEDHIRRRLGCSPAEAAVAQMLAQGLAPRNIAERRGVSIHTVRAQIRALLHAADAKSIAAFVAFVARY